jgi:DNA-binding NarL/FixJ family response regulator
MLLLLGEELVLSGRLAWRGGDADEAYADLVRRTADGRLTSGRLDRSWGTEIDAHLLRAADKDTAAAWVTASASWQELGVPYRASECRVRLAEMLLTDGDREGAARHLATAVSTAEQLNAQPLADEARTLAARGRVALPGAARATSRGGLTDREFEVLQLLATGSTNDQIARALFMSPKTASVHVSHIIAKLDATNRTEVASIAHRRGLLDP